MKRYFLLSILAILVCSAGCGLGMPDLSVYRTVNPKELIGKWKLTRESILHLTADGYFDEGHECTIVFNADKTAQFSSVNSGPSPPEHQIRSGFWQIGPCSTNGDTRVTISEREPSEFGFVSFGFTEKRGALRLWNFHGDPDMWEFIEYTRIE